jgi:hypothetical protein
MLNQNIVKMNENVVYLISQQTNTTEQIKSITKSLNALVQHLIAKGKR